jgi:hypothetical protein
MATNHENFHAWYVEILATLYPHRNAGFAIVMIVFPLFERYLRQRVRLTVQAPLNDVFFDELIGLFPELKDRVTAKQFWQVYRNGLLHEVTMSLQDRSQNQMPVGSLSHDVPGLSRESDGSFFVHPVDFAKRVVQIIEADFSVFEGTASVGPLPSVKAYAPGIESSTVPFILGTNTNRHP